MTAEVIPLGSRLRQRREELGLSQAQAARQLEVARTAYRLWEMEASKPAPDRWRNIARWLGISMNALLVAEQLIDQQEAVEATLAASGGGMTDLEWDVASAAAVGDYFSQERATIADSVRAGNISDAQAANLNRVLARLQGQASSDTRSTWYPGAFRKRFPNDVLAPALGRSALATTVIGIRAGDFETAALLVTELVTNSVKHSDSDWVDVSINLGLNDLRIEVSDESTKTLRPRTPDLLGGWGLQLVGELADRWGVERQGTGKTVWIELDITP